jgi:effector-binding domain-containing protein
MLISAHASSPRGHRSGSSEARVRRRLVLALVLVLTASITGTPLAVMAQTTTPTPAPAPPTPAVPAPATPAPAAPVPAPPAAAQPAEKPAIGRPAETGGGEMREIPAKPVLRLKGQSTWENGFESLRKVIGQLEAEAGRLNLVREGQAMTYFVDSDDLGFTYEVMLPLKAAPPADAKFEKDFDATTSPSGRAIVFTHEGAYDEIDTAYEALTAWLDEKNLVSTGKFLEEYEVIPDKSDDPGMKLKIIVFLK